MRIWHISDTHGLHDQLVVPSDIDVVVHSGDATNSRAGWVNKNEMIRFVEWFAQLAIPQKIFVPGNHDSSVAEREYKPALFREFGIHLLIEDDVTIEGFKFWGSPWVPRYGDWVYMADRSSFTRRWSFIPDDTDVLITHGPPFGVLDATYGSTNKFELTGCRALQKRVFVLRPRLHLFGHIHSCSDIRNSGTRVLPDAGDTVFSNGACCDDGVYEKPTSNGNVLELNKDEK